MAKADLTAQRLRELLDYDPEAGVLTWRVKVPRSKARPGDPAGCVATDGYVVVGIDGEYHKAHRLAWLHTTGTWPERHIDHINGVRSDNRYCNLRAACTGINVHNIHGAPKNSKSGLLGVRQYGGKWRSAIMIGGRITHLGTFETPEQAHETYLAAKRLHHSGFLG